MTWHMDHIAAIFKMGHIKASGYYSSIALTSYLMQENHDNGFILIQVPTASDVAFSDLTKVVASTYP